MNENPGEMPNPLNPTPAANPEPNTAAPSPAPSAATPDPMARPMEQAPAAPVAEPKKKKTGLIVGIVIAVALVIGGVVAALLLLGGNRGDAVAAAMDKLMNGNLPQYAIVNGTIDVAISNDESPISNLKIALDSSSSTTSLINSTTADITATLTGGGDLSVKLSEVYAEGGDLYIKVDELADAIKSAAKSLYGDMDEDMVEEALSSINGVVKMVDGKWLKISVDELKSLTESTADDSTKCLTEFANNAKSSNNSIAEVYRKNPFIGSTTEGVTLASKNYPVYKIVFDEEKLGAFVNGVQDTTLMQDLMKCSNTSKTEVSSEDVSELISQLPTLYVEVDKDNNFSRLYFTGSADEADASMTVDLGFTYPATINVAEPTESEPLTTVIQKVMTQMYSLDSD